MRLPLLAAAAAVICSATFSSVQAHYPYGYRGYSPYGGGVYISRGYSYGYPGYYRTRFYGYRSYGFGGYGFGYRSYYSSFYYPSYYSPGYCGVYSPYVVQPYVVQPYAVQPYIAYQPVIATPVCAPVVVAPACGINVFGGFGGLGGIEVQPAAPAGPPMRVEPKQEKKKDDLPAPPKKKSNQVARDRAWRFIALGDEHFARADYLQAYERYKLAVQAAPDVVEAYLRRGQSLVALRNYELAAGTFKHAFKLTPDWAQTDYRLDTVYGDRRDAKTAHIDRLAEAAEQNVTADLMLLIGAQLYYDGQADRSLKFFRRAAELSRDGEAPVPVLKEAAGKHQRF